MWLLFEFSASFGGNELLGCLNRFNLDFCSSISRFAFALIKVDIFVEVDILIESNFSPNCFSLSNVT